jgi:hypothetical protein
MNFLDDYFGFNWTRLLKANSDAFSAFRAWATGRRDRQILTPENSGTRVCDAPSWLKSRFRGQRQMDGALLLRFFRYTIAHIIRIGPCRQQGLGCIKSKN